jgi:type IX secretion system PorP/SprF family membrane protein
MKKIFIIFLITVCGLAHAQFDPQFTQYMYNESFINPAYAGGHDALSLTALGRKQWLGFSGSPTNVVFSAHTPIANDKIGIGLNFMNESIGVMYRNMALVNVAYRAKLGEGKLCVGLQAGGTGFTERLSQVNTIQANDKQFVQSTPLLFGPNAGAGIYYYTKKWYVGLSAPRMLINTSLGTAVATKFSAGSISYYLTGGYVFTINEDFKLKPTLMIKAVQGAPIQPEINVQAIIKDMVWVGAAYRYTDCLSGMLGWQANSQFRVGYSYDFTLGALQKYNSGSHEIMLNYIFKYKNKNFTNPRYF